MKNKTIKYLCEVLSDTLNASVVDEVIWEVMRILDKYATNANVWKKFRGRKNLIKELKTTLSELNRL